MNTFGKILIGFFFTLLTLIFVFLTTLRFEVLNSSFLFSSFQRNQVYEKLPQELALQIPNDPEIESEEEREAFAKIIGNVKPELAQRIIEDNFLQALSFIDGKSEDINILIPASEIGIPGVSQDIRWSLLQSRTEGEATENRLVGVEGIGKKLYLVWGLVLVILIGLFFLYGKGRNRLLLIAGIVVTVIAAVLRLGLLFLATTITVKEPAQVMLKLMASSLLPDIVTTWIIFGLLLIVLHFIVKRYDKNSR